MKRKKCLIRINNAILTLENKHPSIMIHNYIHNYSVLIHFKLHFDIFGNFLLSSLFTNILCHLPFCVYDALATSWASFTALLEPSFVTGISEAHWANNWKSISSGQNCRSSVSPMSRTVQLHWGTLFPSPKWTKNFHPPIQQGMKGYRCWSCRWFWRMKVSHFENFQGHWSVWAFLQFVVWLQCWHLNKKETRVSTQESDTTDAS